LTRSARTGTQSAHTKKNCAQKKTMRRLLLLATAIAAVVQHAEAAADCPLEYPRYSAQDVLSNKVKPLLLGGIYDLPRCKNGGNCNKGGLYSSFCGFQRSKSGKQYYWDRQLCSAGVRAAAVKHAAGWWVLGGRARRAGGQWAKPIGHYNTHTLTD
jgi:hypothetical protein